jgi:hypothetical protein
MRRLILSCIASLVIYVGLFAAILDRPLTLGALRARIDAGLTRGGALAQPKLVILAGSNAPYSHRCEVIEPIIRRPCVNAGTAVGVGLDYLFARWKLVLHRGDIVYLPLEEAQYPRPRAMAELGPDAAIMLRHDWTTLASLPFRRQVAAVFSSDLRGAVMSVLETILVTDGFRDPRQQVNGSFNAWGDHVGHTLALGAGNKATLVNFVPFHPSAARIAQGDGSAQVADFLAWAKQHGVRAIGGLPTGFIDSPIPDASLAAIQAIYRDQDCPFLQLPNLSRYPRSAFFDTADHLNEAAQIRHSWAVGNALLGTIRNSSALNLAANPTRADADTAAKDQEAGDQQVTDQRLAPRR